MKENLKIIKRFLDHLNTQNLSFESSIQWVDHEFCPNIWKNYKSLNISDKEKTEMFKTLAEFCSSARKCGYEFMKNETGGDIVQFLSSEYNSIGTVYKFIWIVNEPEMLCMQKCMQFSNLVSQYSKFPKFGLRFKN